MKEEFDYIIVGAGSAGCVLADKLSADPRNRVLLVEAGPTDKNPMVRLPKGFAKLAASPAHCYTYGANPGPAGKTGAETWIRGRMLGGSSSINGLQYQRGHAEDYNHWERDLGLKGWGWQEIGRIFRQMENHELGANEFRGAGGPVHVTVTRNRSLLMDKLIDAAGQLGVRHFEDPNEPDHEGIGYMFATVWKGQRWSAANAFLEPARKRSNLRIVTDTAVTRIIFDGLKANGIECREKDKLTKYRAAKEIILAAGALESPKLLQLSGVGAADHLRKLGMQVVHDSPGVGRNMREHLCFTVQYRLAGDYSQNKEYSGWRLALNGIRYMTSRTGLLSTSPYDVTGFLRTRPGLDRPDAQIVAAPMSMDVKAFEGFDKGIKLEDEPGAQILGYGLRPQSQGTALLRSADPAEQLELVHNHLTHEEDRAVAISTVRYMRLLFDQPAIKPFIAQETLPGAHLQSDDEILDLYNQMSGPGYHVTGTCSMGQGAESVVDERLRVRGVTGLRVADISVFPTLVSGNTNGPAMAAAWRASEMILEDNPN
ncbi:GMC family oxidoreductase [Noviherbaspirillum sedimenti]|uniref:GMC oxidoreductase n=1 Tax=Noviherbaspirillum sedimenti TaxID=2320865 RepID=A0A3A3G9S2_9BURK|nr:GMC family oxidoreductase N-terminal domain-containing protein [Noviherbaspirillum sedimenti]RJG03489.1 GMC oxidoreductase [Noviherbaspirillum sedimenti]